MKLILSAALCLICLTAVLAQNSFKLQIGYAFPLGRDYVMENFEAPTVLPIEDGFYYPLAKTSAVYSSFGSGFQIGAGYVRSLSSQFDLDVDVNYLYGKVIQATTVYGSYAATTSRSTNSIQVAPMIRFKLNGKKLVPYVGIGALMSRGTFYTKNESNSSGDYSEIFEKYNFQLGFKNVFGIIHKTGKLSTYVEVGIVSLTIEPTNVEVTDHKVNGSSSYTGFNNSTVNYDRSPTSYNNPMSNLSFNVGVMLSLSSSKSKVTEN